VELTSHWLSNYYSSVAVIAQWLECCASNLRVMGSNPLHAVFMRCFSIVSTSAICPRCHRRRLLKKSTYYSSIRKLLGAFVVELVARWTTDHHHLSSIFSAWAYLKGVSSLTSLHYPWRMPQPSPLFQSC